MCDARLINHWTYFPLMPLTALILLVATAKEKKFSPFVTYNCVQVHEVHYKWYQSKVKTLGPDGLIGVQVCYELCNLTM